MTLINPVAQSTTSSRMKKIFIALCVLLCIISIFLYSNATFNRLFLNKSLVTSLIPISHRSGNITVVLLINKTENIPQEKKISLPPAQNRRFAIFACSIHANTFAYTFYTPITAASWQRIGYQAIVVFVGDFTKPK
ncbi:unnamed protein product, partial [Rotaria magnacalcarata]